jgi:hypothetical protein
MISKQDIYRGYDPGLNEEDDDDKTSLVINNQLQRRNNSFTSPSKFLNQSKYFSRGDVSVRQLNEKENFQKNHPVLTREEESKKSHIQSSKYNFNRFELDENERFLPEDNL